MRIVINECFGGYSLSEEAYKYLDIEWTGYGSAFWDDRSNPKLVECVEALGKKSWGGYAELGIIDSPDDVDWFIDEYDGMEEIHENHRSWS